MADNRKLFVAGEEHTGFGPPTQTEGSSSKPAALVGEMEFAATPASL